MHTCNQLLVLGFFKDAPLFTKTSTPLNRGHSKGRRVRTEEGDGLFHVLEFKKTSSDNSQGGHVHTNLNCAYKRLTLQQYV